MIILVEQRVLALERLVNLSFQSVVLSRLKLVIMGQGATDDAVKGIDLADVPFRYIVVALIEIRRTKHPLRIYQVRGLPFADILIESTFSFTLYFLSLIIIHFARPSEIASVPVAYV